MKFKIERARKYWLQILLFLLAPLLAAQTNTGELRLRVTDQTGAAVKTAVKISSEANQYRTNLSTNDDGRLTVQHMPFGVYQIQIEQEGLAEITKNVEIHSSLPIDLTLALKLQPVKEVVNVNAKAALINPELAGSVSQISESEIQNRLTALPGRSLQDLINTQPGWLYEGNAVLHPRGSEYQTQFVVDGIPLTDNRSPSFGPEIEADDIDSMSIYTAGFPAEYGRKMGGVVEVNTSRETDPGLHGKLVLAGGSYDTAIGYGQVQEKWATIC